MNNKILNKFIIDILKIQSQEKCLILSNQPETPSYEFSQVLFKIISQITSHVTLVVTKSRDLDEEMEETVKNAMFSGVDIIIQTNAREIGTDIKAKTNPYILEGKPFNNPLYYLKSAKKIRAFWTYIDNLDEFISCLDINYKKMKSLSKKLVEKLSITKKIYISSKNGTDLTIDVSDKTRKPHADYDGTQHMAGSGVNIPMGEVLISPVMDKTEGVFVIDGSFNTMFPWSTIVVKSPVRIIFKRGKIVSIEGDKEATIFKENLEKAKKITEDLVRKRELNSQLGETYLNNTFSVGEFAIGVNPNAKIFGSLILDEKKYADCHIAIGRSYDGDPALIHMDSICQKPKVVFEYMNNTQEIILENGEFLIK